MSGAPAPQVEVSVVVACLNGAATLGETLDSLAAQVWDRPWEIVFADNGSTDASVAIFEAEAARHPELAMRLVDASARRSKSHALNLAIRAARGRSLLFCDADDTVAPGWLAAMGRALAAHPFVACRFDLARHNPDWIVGYRDPFQVDRLPVMPHAPFCPVAGGATLGMHRAVFEAVGGFDPAFATNEDIDFCIRAHLAGFRLRFVPEAVYNYRFRAELPAIYAQAFASARADALLRRRYVPDDPGRLDPGRWADWSLRTGRLAACALKTRLIGRRCTELQRARFNERFGTALGDLAGALAHGVAPRREPDQPSLAARLFGRFNRTTIAVRTEARLLELTFDDGPDPAATPRLLEALARHGARATFFMVGSRAARHPGLVARVAAAGHEIGNHSWDHPSLPGLDAAAVAGQLTRTRAALAPHGARLMRPPYGHQDLGTQRVLRRLGYRAVCWSVNGEDWLGHDAATIADAVLARVEPGAIVLLHDSLYSFEDAAFRDRGPTIEAVERIIEGLPGWRFVTVSELLAHGPARQRFWEDRPPPAYLETLQTAEPA